MKSITKFASASLLAVALTHTAHAGHVYAGIIDTNGISGLQAGDALAFVNITTGQGITGASLGTQNMMKVLNGAQAGLYLTAGEGITFTSLSDGLSWNGSAYMPASPFAPTSGSYVELTIASVTGPSGAKVSFWDLAVNASAPLSTYTVGVGLSGTSYINLTDPTLVVGDGVNDGVGEPPTTVQNQTGVDPYGHIHNRSVTVDTPGIYTVSYVIHDANGNQADSAPFVMTYNAVPEPASLTLIVAGGLVVLGVFLHRRRKAANI